MPTTNAEDAARIESEETDLGFEDDRTEEIMFLCDEGSEAETLRHHEDDDDDDFEDEDDESLATLGLMESQLFSLRNRYEASVTKSRSVMDEYRQRLDRVEQSLQRSEREKSVLRRLLEENKTTVVDEFFMEFFLGVMGMAPPLFVYKDRVRKCLRCRGGGSARPSQASPSQARPSRSGVAHGATGSADNRTPPTWERIRTGLRISFLVFVSFVDFTDAILDAALSVTDILDPDPFLHGWALFLLMMNFIARVLGGMFAAVYTHIEDESDREISYFLVEMTILCLQDTAAFVYIVVKRYRIGEIELIDQMSMYMTMLCSILFVVPTLLRYKIIAKQLPPYTSWIIFFNSLFCFYPIIRMFVWDTPFVERHLENACRAVYGTLLSLQLFLLYRWGRYMYRKTLERELDEVDVSRDLTTSVASSSEEERS